MGNINDLEIFFQKNINYFEKDDIDESKELIKKIKFNIEYVNKKTIYLHKFIKEIGKNDY